MLEKPKILIVDDDESILRILSLALVKENYEVITAANGKIAHGFLEAMEFETVITDMNMPGYGGIELLKHIRGKSPNLPVILMTGFTKIIETKTAFELGAKAFLAKPFLLPELLGAIKDARASTAPKVVAEERAPAEVIPEYCRIGIDQFISGKSIKFEIFIMLGPKYFKVAHAGEDIDLDRVRAYKSKGVDFLHIKKADFAEYVGFNLKLSNAVRRSHSISPERKLQLATVTSAVILENLFVNGIRDDSFHQAREITETTVDLLSDSPGGFAVLEALKANGDALYTHSLGVSLFSVLIAKEIGWGSPPTLFKISTAGLLHDIGMKEIDRAISDKPRAARTLEETKNIETHTMRGAAILGCMPEICEEVLQAVAQHHESSDGRGYPGKLPGSKISAMARLVSIADQFCELALADLHSPGLAPKVALDRLSLSVTSASDLVYLNALKKVLN